MEVINGVRNQLYASHLGQFNHADKISVQDAIERLIAEKEWTGNLEASEKYVLQMHERCAADSGC